MSKSSNFNTKTKLQLGFGTIIIAIIVLIIVSFFSFRKINKLHNEMIQLEHLNLKISELHSDENEMNSLVFETLFSKEVSEKDSLKKEIGLIIFKTESNLDFIDSLIAFYPEQQLRMNEIQKSIKEYNNNLTILISYIDNEKIVEAHNFMDKIQMPLYKENDKNLTLLVEYLDVISKNYFEVYQTLSKTINYSLFILGFCVILVSVTIAVTIIKMLKKISLEIKNGVNVLGTSAAEILSTVTEISTGAAETATAVSETTTTVEEVRQTALVSNQKANSLMDSSQKAADSVEKGRESINEVITSMKKIDNQMNIISETVLKLSEQNRTIGEITSSVADIADQSNLLAVNAAIEAAKAGEHGRGFTVVAQEIRSLADQSKKATAQVKEILNEINKSVNQAVGVTEQGTKTVDEGRNLVSQSGEVIELLSENVEETAQSAIQISSSNQQQMAGMDQIVPAMENIKQASEQNVTGIKQAQIAAHDLNKLGQNLKEIIEKFNL